MLVIFTGTVSDCPDLILRLFGIPDPLTPPALKRMPAPWTCSNGGAGVARHYLNAGLIDEVHLHHVPVVLGAGTPLFDGVLPDLRITVRESRSTPAATHVIYDVQPSA